MRNKIILLACTFIVIVSAILTAYFLIQHDQTVKLEQYQNEVVEAMIQQQEEDVINNFKDYYLVLNSNVHKLITNFKDNKNNILVAKIENNTKIPKDILDYFIEWSNYKDTYIEYLNDDANIPDGDKYKVIKQNIIDVLDGVAEYVAFVYTFYENEGDADLAFTINDMGDDLGIDHSFFNDKPIYWETMIFDHTNGEDFGDLYCERYSSLEDAIANHERILTLVTEGNFTTIKELGDACRGFYNLER